MSTLTPDQHTALVMAVARMEGKLDTYLSRQDEHEERISTLEQRSWAILGAGTAFATLVGIVELMPTLKKAFLG